MGTLDGKVAIVTGAGQGVGQGIALALAREGAAIVAAGRTEAKVVRTCEKISAFGGRSLPVLCDICRPADIQMTIERTLSTFGGIDILVNNAQIVHNDLLDNLDDDQFAEVFDSGPFATFRFMKAVKPHMKARGGGNIINLATSGAVRWDAKGYGVYAAAKQAIRSLSRAAAHEWAADGIRVNTIAPIAMTPALEGWIAGDPEGSNAFLNSIPMGRIGDPEQDIGRAVVFLVGPDAGYVTALTMPLDGGQAFFG
ncbi:MAG: putative oxidoreductase [Rhodospirillales bacterium]|nr:putative oxidoreductase [Rhodospirillales bacterium]